MNKNAFHNWLKAIKKLDGRTCNSRISNCSRIEKFYGDLDEIYSTDRCASLLTELTYTTHEMRDNILPKHKIPIDGNQYTGTQTLKSALNLFIEFKENKLLKEIMIMTDVEPDKHDGSYELVRETVNALSDTPIDKIDIADLDMLYFMAVGTWKGGEKFRHEKIAQSHLSVEEKERLSAVFNRVVEKAKRHEYENTEGQWSVGMFGTGFYTFNTKSDKENAQKFISLCTNVAKIDDENEILNMAEEVLKYGIKGIQTAAASIMLHCLKPNVFPIINNSMIEAAVILEGAGVTLVKPKELTSYIKNTHSLKKFRDEKCQFKNYRALDMKFWRVQELAEELVDNTDNALKQNNKVFVDEIGISKEQWKEMLLNTAVFLLKDRKMILDIYDRGGEITASELAAENDRHSSSYNAPVVSLAKRIKAFTNCPIPRRDTGKERWWNIPFNGQYLETGHFQWILRPELKEAVQDLYNELSNIQDIDGDVKYWWLNANPNNWSFNNIEIGESVGYTSTNENGNRRKIYKNFEDVKEGDIVIGYESRPVQAIVALCRIVKAHDGERIWVEKMENLVTPIEYSRLTGIDELKNMEYFRMPRGSLFRLTKEEYDEIMDLVREESPVIPPISHHAYTKEDFLEEVFMEEESYDQINALLTYKKNIILQGAPGVGKTFVAKRLAHSIMGEQDNTRIEMIQFHQSYSYEDFIMGYRPENEGFKLKYGVFYRFCKKAQNDPQRPYFFIIDEINRGNISKIFGEVLMLIEADKRGDTYAVPLTYTESRFYIPENIYVIGTMNTADRSLAMLDYALRRRFCFIELPPAFDNLNFKGYIENKNKDLAAIIIERVRSLNNAIENDLALGKGFCIGHSYFCTPAHTLTEEAYKHIILYEIIPQLTEYWFDEPERVREWKTRLLG